MNKYSDKFTNLKDFEQKDILKKVKASIVEIIIDNSYKTVIIPSQTIKYNEDMRSPSFERQVLEFIKKQEKFNEKQLKFNDDQLKFNENQLKFNEMILNCPTIKKEVKLTKK